MYKKIHVHFIGIGGIGMSSLAAILFQKGHFVSGCDNNHNQETITLLNNLGCSYIFFNNSAECYSLLPDVIVYSSAISDDNPEILRAKRLGIKLVHRSVILAELMREKWSIAVSGSHGKTTTSALISHILLTNNLDPTIAIGGILSTIQSNAHCGSSSLLVAEVDESDRSIQHIPSTLAVITNIDEEHFETYKNLSDIQATFLTFLQKMPFYGKAFLCANDKGSQPLLSIHHPTIITYGFSPHAQWQASVLELLPRSSTFKLYHHSLTTPHIFHLPLPGTHNILNAVASIATCHEIGLSLETIAQSLSLFNGVARRFTYHGKYKQADLFEDYGHHPTEIAAILAVAKRVVKNNLIIVFQPHRFTRTEKLWHSFISVFEKSEIDHLIITDIYPASEKPIKGISSAALRSELQQKKPAFPVTYASCSKNFDYILNVLEKITSKDDLILILGAGNINNILTNMLQFPT